MLVNSSLTREFSGSLGEQGRRSKLIACGGRDLGGEASQGPAAAPSGAQPSENSGTPGRAEGGAPNALDLLRQSSAVGEARASMLPNRNFLIDRKSTRLNSSH